MTAQNRAVAADEWLVRLVNLRVNTSCARCRRRLYAGDCVAWDEPSRTAWCEACAPHGASATMEAWLAVRPSRTSARSR